MSGRPFQYPLVGKIIRLRTRQIAHPSFDSKPSMRAELFRPLIQIKECWSTGSELGCTQDSRQIECLLGALVSSQSTDMICGSRLFVGEAQEKRIRHRNRSQARTRAYGQGDVCAVTKIPSAVQRRWLVSRQAKAKRIRTGASPLDPPRIITESLERQNQSTPNLTSLVEENLTPDGPLWVASGHFELPTPARKFRSPVYFTIRPTKPDQASTRNH